MPARLGVFERKVGDLHVSEHHFELTKLEMYSLVLAYDKLYADDDSWFSGHGQAYLHLGIDPKQGCIAIVRPDQFVSLTCPVEDFESIGELTADPKPVQECRRCEAFCSSSLTSPGFFSLAGTFFDSFMIPPKV